MRIFRAGEDIQGGAAAAPVICSTLARNRLIASVELSIAFNFVGFYICLIMLYSL